MNAERKALFFDIDGTLLSKVNSNIPESAKEALKQARKNGHLVFINSGRTYCMLNSIRGLIEVDGYCCGCGTRIVKGDQVLFSATIPHERGNEIKRIIQEHGLDGVLEGTESCYFRKGTSRLPQMQRLRGLIAKEGNVSPYTWDEDCYDFDKFCVYADEKSDLTGFSRELGLDFGITEQEGEYYECVPAQYTKATAIEAVLNHYRIPRENTYVFGDSNNDLSMFEYAKNCILMGHHSVELEPYATFYTKNVEDDGVAYAMKKLGLI